MIKFSVFYPKFKPERAFTLLELMIVLALMATVAGLVVESGSRSLERARIDAVAVDLAGWLIAMHANNFRADNTAAATPCYVDLASINNPTATTTSLTAIDASYSTGTSVFAIRPDIVNGAPVANQSCSNPERSFAIPDNATGRYQIRAYSPMIFSVRGSVAIAGNVNGVGNDNDIKIYRAGSRLLRCVRIYYSTGTVRIGANGDAADINAQCNQFNTF